MISLYFNIKINRIKILFLVALLFFLPFYNYGQDLKSGDLIFLISGESEFSQAISAATSNGKEYDFSHVGIIIVGEKGELEVLDASPKSGVSQHSLESFLSESVRIDGRPGAVVKRLRDEFPVDKVINKARTFIGQPYDWWYLPDNGKMYCSELIYESYIDTDNNHIFKSNPMNFRDSEGNMPEFWIKLFEKIGEEIPEGVEGTNPNDLSKEACLTEVYRFFPID